MSITVRQETEWDYLLTEYVVEKAFENAEYSEHKEQFLVAGLRRSDAFIQELSLVAEVDENFMALELESGSLDNVSGVVVYPKEFLM